LKIQYSLKQNFALRAGLNYSQKGSKTIFDKSDYPNSDVFKDNIVVKFKYIYIDAPIEAFYYIKLRKKLKGFVMFGGIVNYYVSSNSLTSIDNAKGKWSDETNSMGFSNHIKKFNFAVNCGMGISYSTDKFDFSLHPLFRRDITSMVDNQYAYGMNVYYQSVGLEFGVFYKLGKREKQKEKQ
jgi:hypothetical protein